jgi:hypothetical protein
MAPVETSGRAAVPAIPQRVQACGFTRDHTRLEVELLGHHHDAHPPFTPIRQQIHPLALPPRNPAQFPDHHRPDGARKDALLHAGKGRTFERAPALHIFKPLDGGGRHGVAREPAQDVRFLAVSLLPPR